MGLYLKGSPYLLCRECGSQGRCQVGRDRASSCGRTRAWARVSGNGPLGRPGGSVGLGRAWPPGGACSREQYASLQARSNHRGSTCSLRLVRSLQSPQRYPEPRPGTVSRATWEYSPKDHMWPQQGACLLYQSCPRPPEGLRRSLGVFTRSRGLWLQVAGLASSSAMTPGTRWSVLALWVTSCSWMVSPVKVTSEGWSPCLGASAGGLSQPVWHNLGPLPGGQPGPACHCCLESGLRD